MALLVSVAFDEDAEGVAAAVLAGAALDVLVGARRNRPRRTGMLAATFGAVCVGLWLLYIGLLGGLDGIEWQAEIWLGAAVLNGVAAYAIAAIVPLNDVPTPARQGDPT